LENYIFWSEIGSGYGDPCGTSPPNILRSIHLLPVSQDSDMATLTMP